MPAVLITVMWVTRRLRRRAPAPAHGISTGCADGAARPLTMLESVPGRRLGAGGRVAVIQHTAPHNSGSPLHVHHRENEWFYVLEGELTIWVDGQVIRAPAGSFVFGPQDTPHTFTVSSPEGARFLLVTEPAGFESFMRSCAEPAKALTLPPPPAQPPDAQRMAAIAAEYGIDILGPPGIPS